MNRTRIIAIGTLASVAALAVAADAGADCQSECKKQFPNACYNIKTTKWAKDDDGIARVRYQNVGSFGGAFDWALDELDDPHVGKNVKLRVKAVGAGADVVVHDTADLCNQGYCGFWGLARTWTSGKHIVKGKIWLDTYQMNKNTHAKDLIVRKQVMVHEMLHTLGLNHACVNDNHTMWACGMPNKDYVHTPYMTGCDVDGLIALYGQGNASAKNVALPNMLHNASFQEALDAEPWGNWARAKPDASASRAADHGLLVDVTDETEFAGALQGATAEPDARYRARAMVRHQSGAAKQCLTLSFVSWKSGQAETLATAHVEAGGSAAWHEVAVEAQAPAGTEGIGTFVGNCEVGSSAYAWDSVRLESF